MSAGHNLTTQYKTRASLELTAGLGEQGYGPQPMWVRSRVARRRRRLGCD